MKKIISRKKYRQEMIHLGKKLKLIRKENDLTQSEMICIINPLQNIENRARISQLERNQRVPTLVEILNYARFAGVDVEVLIDDQMELNPADYRFLKNSKNLKKTVGKNQETEKRSLYPNQHKL